MARTPSGRKHLQPLHGGPWLVPRPVFWVLVGITLCGVALMFGSFFVCAVVLQQRTNTLGFFLVVGGAAIAVGTPVVGLLGWLAGGTTQFCPDCLRFMTRGAYVCPYCGFREMP